MAEKLTMRIQVYMKGLDGTIDNTRTYCDIMDEINPGWKFANELETHVQTKLISYSTDSHPYLDTFKIDQLKVHCSTAVSADWGCSDEVPIHTANIKRIMKFIEQGRNNEYLVAVVDPFAGARDKNGTEEKKKKEVRSG